MKTTRMFAAILLAMPASPLLVGPASAASEVYTTNECSIATSGGQQIGHDRDGAVFAPTTYTQVCTVTTWMKTTECKLVAPAEKHWLNDSGGEMTDRVRCPTKVKKINERSTSGPSCHDAYLATRNCAESGSPF